MVAVVSDLCECGDFNMMHIVPKWKVTVKFDVGIHIKEIWISDSHLSNVLRTVSMIDFTETGLVQPISLEISLVPNKIPTTGTINA